MRLAAAGLLAALTLPAPAAADTARPVPRAALADIDAVIEAALADQKIPGAAVAVVAGGEVVLLKGYGFRDRDKRIPMTPDTLVPIASVTKQFTVAALGTLVRRGKLDWDAPVRDYLPEFRLHDDYATLRATPRDLVTHRIGLPRHDLVWFGSDQTREQLVGGLRHLPFSRDIRTRFQYNNLMYMTAGYLGGRIAGTSWEALVRDSLFGPLGMKRSNFSLEAARADADHSEGYQLDRARQIIGDRWESAETMGPTGGINSTAREMANYVRMMLAGGEFEGKRVLLKADVDAMMQPTMPIGPQLFPELGFQSYGMGLFVNTYRGHQMVQHGGNLPGAATTVHMVPAERIGVVVLSNRSGGRLRDGLPLEIIDRLLGLPSAGMIQRYAELERKGYAGEDAARAAGVTDRKADTRPAHPLASYAGEYEHPGYGTLQVGHDAGRLALTIHGFTTPLDHWHYEVFRAPQDDTNRLEQIRVQFQTDLEGEVSGVAVPVEPNVPPTLFTRRPPAQMRERAFLEQLVGVYEVAGIDWEVVLREDGVLQYVILGRPRDLVPVRGTLFRVKELSGVTLEFLKTADGRVDRIAVHGGEGSTIGRRKAVAPPR